MELVDAAVARGDSCPLAASDCSEHWDKQDAWPADIECHAIWAEGHCRPRVQEPDVIVPVDTWQETSYGGGLSTPWAEQARYSVLTLRLQPAYFAYCIVCCFLAAAAFLSTVFDLLHSHRRGMIDRDPSRGWRDTLEGGTWQSACWTIVGLSLILELGFSVVVRRGLGCLRDWWAMFDFAVIALTGMSWLLTCVRQSSPMREEAEEIDVWLLFLRFALQPCRVAVAASTALKVQRMQRNHLDISFDHFSEPKDKHGSKAVRK